MPAGEMLAHSARPKEGISVQTYREHIQHTMKFAEKFFEDMARFHTNKVLMEQTRTTILQAANKHDLGKLFEDNQRVLRSTFDKQKPLPIPHEEAGFWYFFKKNLYESAMLVACHHIGLKNIPTIQDWEKTYLRTSVQNKTKNLNQLSSMLEQHQKLVPMDANNTERLSLSPLGFRLILSCLVDADHLDTAQHYDNEIEEVDIKLFASKRFNQLTNYVQKLQSDGNISARNKLRNLFFDECANIKDQPSSFTFTDAPVGLGKTTSLMASALQLAEQTNARRIIVVLPLSTLISQSSSRYQDAMQLKDSEKFIAENHHRADFSHPYSRALTERWTQPVVVTSHVQFFETLASSKTGRLRKLHQVPGSIIIIDEAHMALPIHLWPLAWQWMNELQDSWGCRFLFASGTLGKFWELEDFELLIEKKPKWIQHRSTVKFLNSGSLATKWHQKEETRVQLFPLGAEVDGIAPWMLNNLVTHVSNAIGPRLVVLNTVASAAVVAEYFHASNKFQDGVYHLSTALTFLDRIKVLSVIKDLLGKKEKTEWVLVATSIAETGLDVSFRNGFREYMSFTSMLQFKGRINREDEFNDSSIVMFELASGQNPLIKQPWKSVRATQNVLKSMLREKLTSPAYSTEALRRELQETQISSVANTLLESERNYKFEDIEKDFEVIQSDTKLILVDGDSFEKLERGFMNASERKKLFRDKAIQMYATKINEMELRESSRFPGVFLWNYGYDNFLGYMRGVIDLQALQDQSYVF